MAKATVLNGAIKNNHGIIQFWKIFYSCFNFINSNSDFSPISRKTKFEHRKREKILILHQLMKCGVWLADSSISGLYTPGKTKLNSKQIKAALLCSWKGYVENAVLNANPEKIIFIGQGVWDTLKPTLPNHIK